MKASVNVLMKLRGTKSENYNYQLFHESITGTRFTHPGDVALSLSTNRDASGVDTVPVLPLKMTDVESYSHA